MRVAGKCGPCLQAQELVIPHGGQIRTHRGYVAPDQPYDCGKCIASHAKDFGFPDLLPANHLAWQLFFAVNDQQRVGMDVIGLDYAVLEHVFNWYGVPWVQRWSLFQKLCVLNHCAQEAHAERVKREREQAEFKRRSSGRG